MHVSGPDQTELLDSHVLPGARAPESAPPALRKRPSGTSRFGFSDVLGTYLASRALELLTFSFAAIALFGAVVIAAVHAAPAYYFGPLTFAVAAGVARVLRALVTRPLAAHADEHKLLRAARHHDGAITEAIAAATLRCSLSAAKARLTALSRRGHVAIEMDEASGTLRYRFQAY